MYTDIINCAVKPDTVSLKTQFVSLQTNFRQNAGQMQSRKCKVRCGSYAADQWVQYAAHSTLTPNTTTAHNKLTNGLKR